MSPRTTAAPRARRRSHLQRASWTAVVVACWHSGVSLALAAPEGSAQVVAAQPTPNPAAPQPAEPAATSDGAGGAQPTTAPTAEHSSPRKQPQGLPPGLGVGLMADDAGSSLPAGLGVGLMADDAGSSLPAGLGAGLMAGDGAEPDDEYAREANTASVLGTSQGEVSLESRVFSRDDRPTTQDQNLGLFARLGFKLEAPTWSLGARIYGRNDYADKQRSLVALEELWAQLTSEHVVIRAGVDIFNWSATEAFHPADIINARNFDSDVERYEKIGEPFASFELRWGQGGITAYYFPYVGRPFLPSRASRLNGLPDQVELGPFQTLDADGQPSPGRFQHQGAVRLRQTIGDADVSLHAVRHVDRSQPELVFSEANGFLLPIVRTVTQFGGAYQQVLSPFIFKMEAGYRMFADPSDSFVELTTLPNRDHLQVAAGVEYTWSWGATESALILEGQSIFLVDAELRRQLHIFQRDALLGYRLALNDTGSTALLLSAILDVENREELLFNASLERRFFTDWMLSAVFRGVTGTRGASAVVLPADSDHVRLSLTRYF